MTERLTRREMMKLTGALAAGSLLAACAPAEPEKVEVEVTREVEVEVPVEQTVIVEVTTEAAPAPEMVTLEHWDFGGGELEYIDTLMKPAFNEGYPYIQIEHVGVPEDGYQTKLRTAVSGGGEPDTAAIFDNTLWKAGRCTALDDLLATEGIDWKNDFYLPIVELHCIIDDGKIYGMPDLAFPWVGKFNVDLFEEAGLDPLTVSTAYDHAQWYQIAKTIDKPSDNIQERIWGVGLMDPKWYTIKHAMASPTWAGEDGRTVVGNVDGPGWIEMYKSMYEVWKEELTPIGAVTEGLGGDPFRLGQMGMNWTSYEGVKADLAEGINVKLCQLPVVGPETGVTGTGGWSTGWSMFKSTQYPDEAWNWLHFMGTDGAAATTEARGTPPMLKTLEAGAQWASNNKFGEDVLEILENLPNIPFTPNFRPIVDPIPAAWTRITEESQPVDEAIHEAALETQENLDRAWEEWELLAE